MILDIEIEADAEWDSRIAWGPLAERATHAAVAESAFPQLATTRRTVEIALRLTSDEEVRALNAQWRGKDKPTNVLSFPMAAPDELADPGQDFDSADGPELMLGDIVLAHTVCATEAADKAIPIEAHAAHLMVHGTLHLLGYDHQDDVAAQDMEARETRALARLGIADPYAGDR
ncbi:rRNA maturation RNase YbeY [Sphingomonas sp.]|uniref:rRNA maturation RNase YbeY n=1 Tax=Sphingomonas sp. TaxID=28214 RepID=UPI0025DF1970|nr:rRNA maturation RNase YbeY [Sphingomonas sp.]